MKKIAVVFFLSLNRQLPEQKLKVFSFIVPLLLIAYSGLQRHRYFQICNLGLKLIRPQKRFFPLIAERSDKKCLFDTVLFMLRAVRLPHLLTDLEQKLLTFKMIARTGAHTGVRLSPLCLNDIIKKFTFTNQLTDLEQKLLFNNLSRGLALLKFKGLHLAGGCAGEINKFPFINLVGFGHSAPPRPAFKKHGLNA